MYMRFPKTAQKLIVVFFIVAIMSPPAWSDPIKSRPNIILIFVDDMGLADLSCFGGTELTTPNIDRLAQEGIAFDQFYVNAPICSPSRVAISTGQYPQRWKITSYLDNRDANQKRGMANWLDPKAPMLARSLKESGYATGHFGKWHMGGQRDVDDAPPISAYGFDESLTNFEGMGAKLLPMILKPDMNEPGRIWADAERLGGPAVWMQRSEITSGYANAAMAFMKRAKDAKKPFYINLWPDDVHSPYYPPVNLWSDNKRGQYLAVLKEMDRQLKPFFDFVRQDPQLRDNTLILLCSDNGHEPGAGQAGPLKGCKTNLYEGGIRSPLIIWGPGILSKEAAGKRNKTSVFAAIDLVPSLLKLTGAKGPEGVLYDGEDLLDTLLGRSQDSRKAPIYFSRPPDRKHFYDFKELPDLAVRSGPWKFLCDYDGRRPQLYNLETDIGELKNMTEAKPELVRELTTEVTNWYKAMP